MAKTIMAEKVVSLALSKLLVVATIDKVSMATVTMRPVGME